MVLFMKEFFSEIAGHEGSYRPTWFNRPTVKKRQIWKT